MASRPAQLLNQLRRLPAAADTPGDAELLARFARDRDEDAFAALVGRHGAMVLRVCRRLLADAHSADDAFQAVFLILARRAGSLRRPEALAAWLHGVARRVALRARSAALKPGHVTTGDAGDRPDASPDPLSELTARELLAALDEEVARLPERYRLPLILCCLEGHSREEAARLLGWAPGSVKGRLERARARLHDRLTRRGLTLPALLLTPLGVATVPAALAAATAKTAIAVAAGKTPAGASAALARPFLGARAAGKWRLLAVLVLAAGLLANSLPTGGDSPPPKKTVARPDRPATDSRPSIAELPLPTGATARLGSLRWKHAARVGVVAFAPAGDALASAGDDGTVILWDPSTGLPKHRLGSVRYNGGYRADCLAFSPNGKILADGRQDYMGIRPGWTWPRLSLIDTASGREVRGLWKTLDGSVRCVAFSPDGKLVAAADDAGAVRVWDAASGKERFKLAPLKGVSWKLAFAPDSKRLFLGRRPSLGGFSQPCPGEVHLWDLGTGKRGRLLVAHPKYAIKALAVSPDNRTLGVLAGYKAALFDVTGKKVRELLPKEDVHSLAFAPDGKSVALGCDRPGLDARGIVWLLDAATGKGRVLAESFADTLAFSADGKRLAAGGRDFTVRLWEVATGKPVAPATGHGDAVTCVAFAPDGRTVVSASYGGTVSIWDVATGTERLRRQLQTGSGSWGSFGYCAGFAQVGFTPGGKLLAARDTTPLMPGQRQDRTVLWDVKSGKALLKVAPLERARGTMPNCAVSFAPDGKTAATGEFESVVLWDVATGKERRRLHGHHGNVYFTRFTRNGRTLATLHSPDAENGDRNDHILLWDVASGKELGRIGGRMLMTFALSPDGKVCATGDSGLIHLWDTATGKMLRTITTPVAPVHCLAFSPDGRLLASGDTVGGLFLCDPASGEEVLRASGHHGSVTALAFAGDRRLASASLDTTVLVWNLAALALAPGRPHGALSGEELEQAWDDLARDAKTAYRAQWLLRTAPDQGLTLLRRRLHPARAVSEDQHRRLIAELDSDKFAVRERATQELAQRGTAAEKALRGALKNAPTLELRKRVTDLLARLKTDAQGERRRALRGILLLERIGTREARTLLERLAGGTPDAPQTREAKIALGHLLHQPSR